MPLPREIKQALLAQFEGYLDRWVLKKHNLYYRPDACGYTSEIEKAWVIPEAVADRHTYPHYQPVTKHKLPPPEYFSDLNLTHRLEKRLDSRQVWQYLRELALIQDAHSETADQLRSCCWHAPAEERAEALGVAFGLWDREGNPAVTLPIDTAAPAAHLRPA